jgi:type VI protein secretion system component Hcp
MSTSLLLLELPGVTGDCSIVGFSGHIALESFSWGLHADSTKSDAKGEKAKISVKFEKLQFSKYYDSASIQLCNLMNSDTKIEKGVVLKFVDPTSAGSNSKFESIMEMELKEVYIESISLRASESGKAISVTEDVVMSFHEVALRYYAYDPVKKTRVLGSPFESAQPKVST